MGAAHLKAPTLLTRTDDDIAYGCEGKVRFETRKLAMDAGNRKETKQRRHARSPYRCQTCYGWHLGTPNPHAR